MSSKNNFNNIAWIYDLLARIVFGATWRKVQTSFIKPIKPYTHILILGGGTGACLECLEPHHQVTFLDLSDKMIERAKQRNTLAKVNFIKDDFLKWENDIHFDAVVCPFFLDSFSNPEVETVIRKIKTMLAPHSELIVVDFQQGTWSQNAVMKLMHLFFKMSANLKSSHLLDLNRLVKTEGFIEQDVRYFYGRWVACRVYVIDDSHPN
jgi:ubiquinone/menaquinone biosynthesis C-methylase UbiE